MRFLPSSSSALALSLAGFAVLAGCSKEPAAERETPAMADSFEVDADWPEEPAAQEAEEQAGFTTETPLIRIDPVGSVPKAPRSAATQQDCAGHLARTLSPAARQLASAGWGVTGEAAFGPYHAVSFAGMFKPSTSSSCAISRGNVALFEGAQLLAIASVPTDQKATIASVQAFDGGLRIWTGDLVPQPLAEMVLQNGKTVAVKPLASSQKLCGSAEVPNIYNLPISEARRKLDEKGWKAANNGVAQSRMDGREAELAAAGITEVESCSGTGFAFCSFDYTQKSMRLNVVTAGEGPDPQVTDFGADCG